MDDLTLEPAAHDVRTWQDVVPANKVKWSVLQTLADEDATPTTADLAASQFSDAARGKEQPNAPTANHHLG